MLMAKGNWHTRYKDCTLYMGKVIGVVKGVSREKCNDNKQEASDHSIWGLKMCQVPNMPKHNPVLWNQNTLLVADPSGGVCGINSKVTGRHIVQTPCYSGYISGGGQKPQVCNIAQVPISICVFSFKVIV